MTMNVQAGATGGSKPKKRGHVQLFVELGLYRRMQSRARKESLALSIWLRRLAIRELRRKPTV